MTPADSTPEQVQALLADWQDARHRMYIDVETLKKMGVLKTFRAGNSHVEFRLADWGTPDDEPPIISLSFGLCSVCDEKALRELAAMLNEVLAHADKLRALGIEVR